MDDDWCNQDPPPLAADTFVGRESEQADGNKEAQTRGIGDESEQADDGTDDEGCGDANDPVAEDVIENEDGADGQAATDECGDDAIHLND